MLTVKSVITTKSSRAAAEAQSTFIAPKMGASVAYSFQAKLKKQVLFI